MTDDFGLMIAGGWIFSYWTSWESCKIEMTYLQEEVIEFIAQLKSQEDDGESFKVK